MYGLALGPEGLAWEGGAGEGLNVKRRWPTLEARFEKEKRKKNGIRLGCWTGH